MSADDVDAFHLTVQAYATRVGASERTVRRWLAASALPGAYLVGGEWRIPAATPRPVGATTALSVVPGPAPAPVVAPHPLGHLGTLEDAAAALDTTVGGIRRMGRDGHLVVGPYGPNGALRVYLPPRTSP